MTGVGGMQSGGVMRSSGWPAARMEALRDDAGRTLSAGSMNSMYSEQSAAECVQSVGAGGFQATAATVGHKRPVAKDCFQANSVKPPRSARSQPA